ncbi:TPA: acyl carrier protein [Legionella pneumophila]|nr:acyl carrier protein [Legionella pneumophila]HCX3341490.1 acyl carrier protein [Legionella pneumophila]
MLSNRIEQVLERIGLTNLPENKQAKLEQGGLDSLMLALLIIELEREFEIKIPVIPLEKEYYESINTIEQYLIELGAK